jgi:hypothetical protein
LHAGHIGRWFVCLSMTPCPQHPNPAALAVCKNRLGGKIFKALLDRRNGRGGEKLISWGRPNLARPA